MPGERKERQDFNAAQLKRLCEVYDMDPTQVSVSLTLRVRLYSRVRLRLRVRLRARVCRGVCWGGVVAMQLLSCRRVHGLGFGVYAVCVASVQLCWCPCVVTGVCFAWCTQRPDREIVAKEIDKLEGGRPVTQYGPHCTRQPVYQYHRYSHECVCLSVFMSVCLPACLYLFVCGVKGKTIDAKGQGCHSDTQTHVHARTHVNVSIHEVVYMYVFVCVCVSVCIWAACIVCTCAHVLLYVC